MWCLPVYPHIPFLDGQIFRSEERSINQDTILVLFRQAEPYPQKSSVIERMGVCLNNLFKAEQFQIREAHGFSMEPGIRNFRAVNATLAVARAQALPASTFNLSATLNEGRPSGNSSDRSGGGPPPISRALENDEHGVPKCSASIKPPAMAPRLFCNVARSSKLQPWMTSHSIAIQPRARIARLHFPDPANNSSATFGATVRDCLRRATVARLQARSRQLTTDIVRSDVGRDLEAV